MQNLARFRWPWVVLAVLGLLLGVWMLARGGSDVDPDASPAASPGVPGRQPFPRDRATTLEQGTRRVSGDRPLPLPVPGLDQGQGQKALSGQVDGSPERLR